MEKEKIVKALECCASGTCGGCTFYDAGEFGDIEKCTKALAAASLSLHREQEKRIEELTLEYAGFEAGAKDAANFIQAATVRNMHDEIKRRLLKGGIYPAFVACVIDNVAREMLEDQKCDTTEKP